MDDVAKERARCVAIVDCVILEAGDESHWLCRIRNMIANGLEPMTFREQIEEGLEELEAKP